MGIMLNLQNITVKKDDKFILKNINFSCTEGDKILIYGPSGSGKSTFLKTLLFFEPIYSGKIELENKEISKKNIDKYRKNFVYIGQKAPHFQGLAHEFICLPFTFKKNILKKPSAKKVKVMLHDLNFSEDILQKEYENLSGGEQQRLCIIQALLLNKMFFLLDEITSNLDRKNSEIVIDKILEDPYRAVIAVSHDTQWQDKNMKRFILNKGKMQHE